MNTKFYFKSILLLLVFAVFSCSSEEIPDEPHDSEANKTVVLIKGLSFNSGTEFIGVPQLNEELFNTASVAAYVSTDEGETWEQLSNLRKVQIGEVSFYSRADYTNVYLRICFNIHPTCPINPDA